MARSIRVIYRNVQGRIRTNVNWDAITVDTSVIVTAAEWAPTGGISGILVGRPLLGDANVYVTNVGPHGSGSMCSTIRATSRRPAPSASASSMGM